MRDPTIKKWAERLNRKTPLVSGTVVSVNLDTVSGRQVSARVRVSSSIVDVQLNPGDPLLGNGHGVTLAQFGGPTSAIYRLHTLTGATYPTSGYFQFLDPNTLYGQTYEGGDVLLGGLIGGNVWSEYLTGNLHQRVGNNIYALDSSSAPTINGTPHGAGTKVIGALTRTAQNTYTAAGPNLILSSASILLNSGTATRIRLASDGSGSLASGNIAWNTAGVLTVGGWTIGASDLKAGSGATTVGLDAGGTNPAIYAGSATPASAPFQVTNAGVLTATSGVIQGLLEVGNTSGSHIHINGTTGLLESSNFVAGSTGWQVGPGGSAEFNNITARGAIKTAVFEKAQVSAFAGSQIVAKSASTLYESCTSGSALFTIKTALQSGAAPFANGDIIRIKNGGVDTWASVDAGSAGSLYWQYTAQYRAGTSGSLFLAGQAVVDYGQSGQGYFIVSADGLLGASAAWALRSHAGAPWTTETTHVYAGTDGKLYAAGQNLVIDENGIGITAGTAYEKKTNYSFLYTGSEFSGLAARAVADNSYLKLFCNSHADTAATIEISAITSAGRVPTILLYASDGTNTNQAFFDMDGLYMIGDFADFDTGTFRIRGALKMFRNSLDYTAYPFVPLTAPLTSTSWDGDARSTTAKTLIDLSAVFGAPAGIKAALVIAGVADSGSAGSDTYLILSPNGTAGSGVWVSPMPVNSRDNRGCLTVPCDANGDIYYQIAASGASTFTATLQILGYWI